jgi:predicted nuclease of predicted toxin-antitoxin system
VKFVVDHQLPPALARFLESQGHIAFHVRELGLKAADDAIIWSRAKADDLVVVTKDEDFFFRASAPNASAKLVWVRMGNCRTRFLPEKFRVHLPQIIASFEAGSNIVELRQ